MMYISLLFMFLAGASQAAAGGGRKSEIMDANIGTCMSTHLYKYIYIYTYSIDLAGVRMIPAEE